MAALLAAAVPAGALAAEQPLSNTVDPSAVVPQAPSASRPIDPPARGAPGDTQDKTPRFTLTRVEFEGAVTVGPDRLRAAWADLAGKAVSLADLHAVAKRAEKIYAQAGYPYVAVVLTPQKVDDGVVRMKVVEGRVSSLTVLSNDPVARRQAANAFGPLVERTPLSAADTEEAYERAKAVPGLTVGGALRRGSVPGGMDLVVQAKHQDWRVYANTNNLYPNVVGPWGVLLGIDHFGGSAYGDQTSLQLYSSVDGGEQRVARISHRQVINASGTEISAMALTAKAKPAGAVSLLDLATNVTSGRLAVTQPLISRLGFTMAGTASFEASDQETKVFSSVSVTNDRLRIVSLSLGGQWRGEHGGRVDYDLAFRQGMDGLNSSREGDIGLSRQNADPQATVGRLTVQALSPKYGPLRMFATFDGQLTDTPLTAPEQFAIGNLTIGRGYQSGAAFGDSAVAASVEGRFGPYRLGKVAAQPFVFYDTARLWTLTPGAHRDHSIASAGGGVRFEVPGRAHLDVTYAVPLDPPLGLGESTPPPKVLVSLTVGLDDLFGGLRRPGAAK